MSPFPFEDAEVVVEVTESGVVGDDYDRYETHWHSGVPKKGRWFRVLRQEWTDGFTVRHVYEWEYTDG